MLKAHLSKTMFLSLLMALALLLLPPWAETQSKATPIYVDGRGIAIGGFDVVEYFRSNEAKAGGSTWTATYRGATFRFASRANRDEFESDPERYVPQFGGHCAYAMSQGGLRKCDPQRFSLQDGRLYLFSSDRVRKRWLSRETDLLAAALDAWRNLFP